jgi:TonB family protein
MAESKEDVAPEAKSSEAKTKEWTGPSRRRVPRFALQTPLDVTVLRSGLPDTVPGRSLNLCERGISAMMAGELLPGETVGVDVRLPLAGEHLRARAMVRYQDKLRCGLEFVGLSAEQRASIRDWAKDAKALDPEVHLSAISGVGRSGESGSNSVQKDSTGHAAEEFIAAVADDKAFSRTGTKWARNSPEEKSRHGKNKNKKNKKADYADASALPGHIVSVPLGAGQPAVQQKRRLRWIIVPIALVIAAAAFWWHWSQSWDELESGLKTQQAAAVEKPQAQVPAEVMEKLLVHRVEPKYPPEARQAGMEGIIALDVIVGRDGSVVSMRALNGPDVLARAAIDALRWWRFEPYRVNGDPAVVETTVAVEFKR